MKRFVVLVLVAVALFAVAPVAMAAGNSQISLPPMTPEALAGAVAVLLSLGMAYIPGLDTWYAGLTTKGKAGLMVVLLILLSAAVFAASCGGIVQAGLTCDKAGAWSFVNILIAALVANQGTFMLAVDPYKKY